MLLILLLGPSLPASCEYAKMITSPSGNGAIYFGSGCKTISNDLHDNVIYEMKILSNGTMKWTGINHKLKFKRELPVIDYIDESNVSCYQKPIYDSTITTTTTTTTTTIDETTVPQEKGKFVICLHFVLSAMCNTFLQVENSLFMLES